MNKKEALVVGSSVLLLAPVFKILEFTLLPSRIDLIMVLSCAVGWSCSPWVSGPSGFVLGLMDDMFAGRLLGVRALSLMIVAILVSSSKRFISSEMLFSKGIVSSLCSGIGDVVSLVLFRALGILFGSSYALSTIIPRTMIWTFFLLIPIDMALIAIANLLERVLPEHSHKMGGLNL
jgi:rod shape-determining protein MreD